MSVSRRGLPVLLAAVLAAPLAGCADQTESYCEALAGEKGTLAELAAAGAERGDVLDATLEVLGDLRAEAPGDVADEWSTLVFAYEGLAEAFEAAGTGPDEFRPGSVPPGVTPQQAERIEGAAAELRSLRVVRAADGLEQHARDVCKVDLGLGG